MIPTALLESDADPDPIRQFRQWYDLVLAAQAPKADAMVLSTVGADGRPSARTVLLRAYDERGFGFFTNYDSHKGRDLDANPFAALTFYWPLPDRQVRIEGKVERVTESESDAYFQSRPRGHQLSAWVSPQSRVVRDRDELEHRMREVTEQYKDGPVPRPSYWGGYRLVPDLIEFWQNRDDRLHDRLCYRRQAGGGWKIERLAP